MPTTPLSEELRRQDVVFLFERVKTKAAPLFVDGIASVKYTDYTMSLLKLLTTRAAINAVSMSRQSETYINTIVDTIIGVLQTNEGSLLENSQLMSHVVGIERELEALEARERAELAAMLQHNGADFSEKAIHEVSPSAQLTDVQLMSMMPASSVALSVFAPYDCNVLANLETIKDGLKADLENPAIHMLMLPINKIFAGGPARHWRSMSIIKRGTDDEKHRVEIYDSYGDRSAADIRLEVEEILEESGQNLQDFDIVYTSSAHSQRDGYSCADYVCARAHQLAKAIDFPFNQDLIDVLEGYGNQDNMLRAMTRHQSRLMAGLESAFVYPAPEPENKNDDSSYGMLLGAMKNCLAIDKASVVEDLLTVADTVLDSATKVKDYSYQGLNMAVGAVSSCFFGVKDNEEQEESSSLGKTKQI